ncbi:MAG: roadblock/LC7 domain-containing protein [Longimicrobiales bacterium]|nr:roadblock/LC7 domain-containing protein [Longimicrobiales bacterium]
MSPDPLASLGPEDLKRVDRLLESFVSEAGARCALLLDRAGRPLTAFGETQELDQTSFASLAAADFDASDELAGLLGEREFTSLYHQGVDGSMYLSEISGIAILAAVFDRRTTLGMVRLKTREVVPRLVDLLDELGAREGEGGRLDENFADDAVSEIDRLFTG